MSAALSSGSELLHFAYPCASPSLALSLDRLHVRHRGPAAHSADYAILHTDAPLTVDESTGVFYCEFSVESFGKHGECSVGITPVQSAAINPSTRAKYMHATTHTDPSTSYSSSTNVALGLEHPQSFAVQLPNGRLTSIAHSKGTSFLSCLQPGDTIGIGVNIVSSPSLSEATVFFTRNGALVSDRELAYDLTASPCYFPCVCLHSDGESVSANFGQTPFRFDLAAYQSLNQRHRANFVHDAHFDSNLILPLIRNYLQFHGYGSTLKTLDASELNDRKQKIHLKFAPPITSASSGSDSAVESSIDIRTKIRSLIQGYAVSEAISEIESVFPGLMASDDEVSFHLLALQLGKILTATSPSTNSGNGSNQLNGHDGNGSSLATALEFIRTKLQRFDHHAKLSDLFAAVITMLALPSTLFHSLPLVSLKHRQHVADLVNLRIIAHAATLKTEAATPPLLLSELEWTFCQLLTTENYLHRAMPKARQRSKGERRRKVREMLQSRVEL